MGKAIITITDEQDEVRFRIDFDPELKNDSMASPAQAVAIGMLQKVKLDGLEKTLAPFVNGAYIATDAGNTIYVKNPKEEPQPQEKIDD